MAFLGVPSAKGRFWILGQCLKDLHLLIPSGVLQHSHFQKAADLSSVIIKFSLLLFNLCHL